jgi:hypothetical protein
MTQCDPSPGAANTCPGGYHCAADGFCDALCTPGGGECGDGYICTTDGRCKGENECTGLECDVVDCQKQGKPDTTVSGTVFAPNGTLPLYGIKVYVPNAPVPAFTDGAECGRCTTDDQLPGSPVKGIVATTDEAGHFSLPSVPKGSNIPLVITSGKWRRQLTIPTVGECADTPLAATDTRLPKNRTEGDMPKIALSTGSADALECLIRKLGIDDGEIGTDGGQERVHLFADTGAGGGKGADHFSAGNKQFANSATLWNSAAKLKEYDIAIFSCEGAQHSESKSQQAMDNLKEYADIGGRVFLSHWHNIWIEGATTPAGNQRPQVWTQIAEWNNGNTTFSTPPDRIDENANPKGASFATWMLNVGGSPQGMRGVIPIGANTGKNTVNKIDAARAERWVYWPNNNQELPQNFQFTTPNEAAADARCGKVVFSDMHVSGDSSSPSGGGFPDSCSSSALTPQEKALAFMFFDLASCVSVIL